MVLKICHVISGDLWAGAEVMAYHLLSGLRQRPDIELLVIILNKGQLSDALERAGVAICVLDETRGGLSKLARNATRAVRAFRPHVIHSHRYKENFLAFVASVALRAGVVLVSTQHGMPELYGGGSGWQSQLKIRLNNLLLAKAFDLTIAVSSDIEHSLTRNFGFHKSRVEIIRNGIVVPPLQGVRVPRINFVIGSAGRFVPVKDYPFLVKVAKEVCQKNPNINFRLAGDGPMMGDMQNLIVQDGLQDRIALNGFIADLDEFYADLDVFLNTSLHEGIPMSVLEAMARGIPIIAPRIGGLGEIIDNGREGYLVETRDPKDFAKRCLSLCENENERREMGHLARSRTVSAFSVDRMVNEYLAMYTRTSTLKSGRPGTEVH